MNITIKLNLCVNSIQFNENLEMNAIEHSISTTTCSLVPCPPLNSIYLTDPSTIQSYLLNLCSIFTLFRLSHQMFHSPSLRASIQWEWLSWLTLRKTPTTPPRNTLQTFTKKDAENPRIGARACNVMLIHSREYFWRFPSCTPAYTRLVQIWLN